MGEGGGFALNPAAWGDILKIHIQSGLGGGGGQKIGHPALAGARIAGGQKRRVHAGQRDQLTQQFSGSVIPPGTSEYPPP